MPSLANHNGVRGNKMGILLTRKQLRKIRIDVPYSFRRDYAHEHDEAVAKAQLEEVATWLLDMREMAGICGIAEPNRLEWHSLQANILGDLRQALLKEIE